MIAMDLAITPKEAAATCMEVWEWAGTQTVDGFIAGIPRDQVDIICNLKGMGKAMEHAGWLLCDGEGITFPKFTTKNGRSAKRRMVEAERVRLARTG